MLDEKAVSIIEDALRGGCVVEVKIEKGTLAVIKKREKREVIYKGSGTT